jgi:hypothetical protein
LKKLKQLDLNKELCYIESRLKNKKGGRKMGKVLMYTAFFIALLAMGEAVVESDFGARATEIFTFSTFLLISAIVLYLIGDSLEKLEKFLEKRKEERNGRSSMRFFTKR